MDIRFLFIGEKHVGKKSIIARFKILNCSKTTTLSINSLTKILQTKMKGQLNMLRKQSKKKTGKNLPDKMKNSIKDIKENSITWRNYITSKR